MRDNSTPLESDPRSPEPDPIAGTNRPGDVDQMVFSFLSELNTLSDALGSTRARPAESEEGAAIAADRPDPADAQSPAQKPVSYRNIDVLLMDNRQRNRDELPLEIHGIFESQSPAHSAGTRRRHIRMLMCSAASVILLGTLGVLFYFETRQSIKPEEIAVPLHTSSSPAVAGVGAAAPPPEAVSPAVVIEKVNPRYPAEARRLGVRGTVELDAEVDEHGKVVRALAVSGPLMLRPAAAEALLKWRFKPAQRRGVNLRSTARVSVVFNR